MALELIKGDVVIRNLNLGAKRLSDGGGLYLLPKKEEGGSHGWRFDYSFEGKRKTLSLGIYPTVGLADARVKAKEFRKKIAEGINPSEERKDKRKKIVQAMEDQRRVEAGEPIAGSFEDLKSNGLVPGKFQHGPPWQGRVLMHVAGPR